MQLGQILKVALITVCVFFVGFQVMNFEFQASGARLLLVFLLMTLYCINVKPKRLLFFLFLLSFSLAEILSFVSWFVQIDYSKHPDYFYYSVNAFYILSYLFLIIRVIREMDVRHVLSKFWIHLIILTVLDIFCVVIVTATAENRLSPSQYMLELVYNSIIMLLLTGAMINYMSKNSQKSMNLLLGSIFIFFAEVIQMTYFYISNITVLNVICSLFLVFAFLFFYLQARMTEETEHIEIPRDKNV